VTRAGPSPRWSPDDLPVALIFLVLAGLAFLSPPQPDTWFHLRAGQEMWDTGSLIRIERFSYTGAGRPWDNHEWLFQVLFYSVFTLGGPLLLTLMTGGSALAAAVASWRMMRGGYELRLTLLLALVLLMPAGLAVRPQALSLLVLMLAIHLANSGRLLWLPVLIAVWANAHGVVLFGVVVAAASALDSLLWSHERRRQAVTVAALCLAAPSLSPLGWRYWPRVFQTVSEARLMGIQEFRPAFEFNALPFWAMFLALVAISLWRFRDFGRFRLADRQLVLVAGALGAASVLSVRNVPFFALAAGPALCALLTQVDTPSRRLPTRGPSLIPVGVGACLVVAVLAFKWRDGGAHLGWKPMSEAAVRAVRACPAPIFNTFAAGGTLLWFVPEQRVFVDGRMEAYPLDILERSRQADLYGDYESLFQDFGIRCAVVPSASPIADALRRDQWGQVRFSDTQWSVFAGS
jgi:hypothetical protein